MRHCRGRCLSRSRQRLRLSIDADLQRGGFACRSCMSRRDFLASASLAAAAGVLGARASLADEGPPETTTIRLRVDRRPSASRPLVHRRGAAARGGLHRYPLRARAVRPLADGGVARGEIDFDSDFAAWIVSSPGCRRADHGAGGCASRLLRAVRARAHPNHQRPEGQEGRHHERSARAGTCTSRSWRRMSGSTPSKDIEWVTPGRRNHRWSCSPREGRCLPRLSARAAGAARPQDRSRDPQHDHGPAMVAVFLLHDVRQPRLRPRSSGRDQARPARHPQGRRPLRRRAGAGRATAGRWRVHAALRLRAPDADGAALRRWREFDPEDSLRFYALRLHEVGMIKSSPNQLIAEGTDWRFLNELKRELKA